MKLEYENQSIFSLYYSTGLTSITHMNILGTSIFNTRFGLECTLFIDPVTFPPPTPGKYILTYLCEHTSVPSTESTPLQQFHVHMES